MYSILIIEDDKTISRIINEELIKWGFHSAVLEDFENVDSYVKENPPQLILLDINLPFYNGFYWCEKIRTFSSVPIIFISSAGDNMNMVTALYAGADDFVAKPFELSVLIAKIKSLLRRTYEFADTSNIITHKNTALDLEKAVFKVDDNQINLSKNEFLIIKLLLENKGQIVSRNKLMEFLWDSEEFVDDNTLTVNISRIRNKLSEHGLDDFIITKKGLGYLIDG